MSFNANVHLQETTETTTKQNDVKKQKTKKTYSLPHLSTLVFSSHLFYQALKYPFWTLS